MLLCVSRGMFFLSVEHDLGPLLHTPGFLMCEHTQVHECARERAAHACLMLNLNMLKCLFDLYVTLREAEILCLTSPGINKFRLCRQL